MAQQRSPETHTEEAQRHGPVGHTAHSGSSTERTTATTVAVGLAVVGVVAGIVPGFWFVALPIGLVSLAIAEPIRRSGPDAAGHRMARYAVRLAVFTLVLSVLNFVVTFGGFAYFTTDGDSLLG